ncbi:hypothetical protein C0J52_04022 [Blattella germanica]|nr:hypothetical protein C0J52_04022 [Blattella germanica]
MTTEQINILLTTVKNKTGDQSINIHGAVPHRSHINVDRAIYSDLRSEEPELVGSHSFPKEVGTPAASL